MIRVFKGLETAVRSLEKDGGNLERHMERFRNPLDLCCVFIW